LLVPPFGTDEQSMLTFRFSPGPDGLAESVGNESIVLVKWPYLLV
jgi:hypothetical protein